MDSISSETMLKVRQELSRSEALRLEILKESAFEKHGNNADLLGVFFKTSSGERWPIFTLLYPKVAFLIDKIVDVIREVDKLFIDEFELKLYGIQCPLSYVKNNRLDQWRARFDLIIAAGPGSGLWDDTVWEFKYPVNKAGRGSLLDQLDQMDAALVAVPERVLCQVEESIECIRARFDFLADGMATIERCETEHAKDVLVRFGRRRSLTPESLSDSDRTETGLCHSSMADNQPTAIEEEEEKKEESPPIDGKPPYAEIPRPPPDPTRTYTHTRPSPPVYPFYRIPDPPTPSKSPLTTATTTTTTSHNGTSSSSKWLQRFTPNWGALTGIGTTGIGTTGIGQQKRALLLYLIPCLLVAVVAVVVASAIFIGGVVVGVVALTRTPPPTTFVVVPMSNNYLDKSFVTNASRVTVVVTLHS